MNPCHADNTSLPTQFKVLVSELIASYYTEKPENFVEFAYKFFNAKDISRREDLKSLSFRRHSVRAEPVLLNSPSSYTALYFPKTESEVAMLKAAAKKAWFFATLEESDLQQVIDAMKSKKVAKDEVIIRQGEEGDYFYIIQEGKFEAVKTEESGRVTLLKTYSNEGSFGELALLYNTPRYCTITAKTDGVLWAIDRRYFRYIVTLNAYKKNMKRDYLIDNVPMLKVLSRKEVVRLADALITKTYSDGERIIRQGDEPDGMYFIADGTVRVTLRSWKGESEMKRLHVGDYFGEMALVMKQPRAASVYSAGTTKLEFLETEAFERLLGPCINIMKRRFPVYKRQSELMSNVT